MAVPNVVINTGMKKLVIIPGGFHPFHAGHKDLYDRAVATFPRADVYIAASDDRSERPFPFRVKKALAQLAGVPPHRFIQVTSPFKATEITNHYDPDSTQLIFVKSTKNAKTGSDPEGPFPAEVDPKTGKLPLVTRGPNKGKPVSDWLQYYRRTGLMPMSQHGYLLYLPTKEFNGMTSGSEIRSKWPNWSDETRMQFVKMLYPNIAKDVKLQQMAVKLISTALDNAAGVKENLQGVPLGAGAISPVTTPMPDPLNTDMDEARLSVDKQNQTVITPDGGMGTWSKQALITALGRDFASVLEMIKSHSYAAAYQSMYDKHSPMRSRFKALAQYENFSNKMGKNIKPGVDYDMSQHSDYVDEHAES